MEADGAVDAQNAPTAPWKTLLVFHELPQGFPHPITHDKPRKSPESYWETRIDPIKLVPQIPVPFCHFRPACQDQREKHAASDAEGCHGGNEGRDCGRGEQNTHD